MCECVYLFLSVCNNCDSSPTVDCQCHTDGGTSHVRRLVNSAALVRFTARINMVCVKKRHVGNYQKMEGQRDGSLFGTAWTLMLSESENGISLPQRKETALPFSPFVSGHVCCATPDAPRL